MKLFKSNRKKYSVIKLFKVVSVSQAKKNDILNCIRYSLEIISQTQSEYPDKYEINFGQKKWKSKEEFEKALLKIDRENIVDFFASFSKSRTSLNIDKNILNIDEKVAPSKSLMSNEI